MRIFENKGFRAHYLKRVEDLKTIVDTGFVDHKVDYFSLTKDLWAEATALVVIGAATGDKELREFGLEIKEAINQGHDILLIRWRAGHV